MSFDRTLQLKLIADVGGLNKDLKKTEGRMAKLGRSAKSWGAAFTKGLVIGGIAKVSDAIGQGIQDFKDGENAAKNLGQTWSKLGLDGEDLVETLAKMEQRTLNLGFDDPTVIQSFDKFLQMTGDAGKANKLLAAAQDLARAEGISLAEAQRKVVAIYNGSSRALREYGVEGKKGMGAVNAALKTNKGKAKEWAKNNPIARLQNKINKLFEKFGGVIVPLLEKGAVFLEEHLNPTMDAVATGWGALVDTWNSIPENLQMVIAGLAVAFGALAVALWANPAVLAVGGFFAAVAALGVLVQNFEDMDPAMRAAAAGAAVLAAAIGVVSAALWANPVVLFVAGIVAAGIGLAIALTWISQEVGEWVENIKGWIGGASDWIANTYDDFVAAGSDIVQGLMDGLATKWRELVVEVKKLINNFLGLWNKMDPSIDFDEFVVWEGWKDVPMVPDLPKLSIGPVHSGDLIPDVGLIPFAKGGIVTGPTAALIGEAGPEAVIPLNRSNGMMGNTYNINVNATAADPAEVGRKIVDAIKRYEGRAGTSWRTA